ncbi:MAG TPA: hypothetical protein VEC60_04575 [Reyranella sp.]|nr:hypothetical protein [Reyranella sp.]
MGQALRVVGETPQAHLVVGIVGPVGDRRDRTLGHLFEELIDAQGAQGAYGVGEVQTGDHLTLHCAFQLKADADRFAASLQATTVLRYPGFASQRQFLVSAGVLRAISNVVEARR